MPPQFSLPRRRNAMKSGIERGGRREYPRHRKFVRSYACCVEGCDMGPIEFAHVRTAANAGTGIKPADWWGVSLCAHHHRESHQIGILSFEKKYQTNLAELAGQFSSASPDTAMKEAMRALEPAMTEQPPSAEATQRAKRIGLWDCTDDSGARAIDALIAQCVSAETERCAQLAADPIRPTDPDVLRATAREIARWWFGPAPVEHDHQIIERITAAISALSAVASERDAALLARLREPGVREAVSDAIARVPNYGNAYVQNLNRADVALTKIAEMLK